MRLAIIAAFAALACGAAQAAPLEAYGKLPTMDHVSISPDGTKVAFVQQVNGKYAVVVDQLDPAAVVIELAPTEQKVRSLLWADPTHLLVIKSQSGFAYGVRSNLNEWYVVQNLDLTKRKATPLFDQAPDHGPGTLIRRENTMNTISEIPEVRTVNGHTVVFIRGIIFVDSAGAPALMSVDLASHEERVIEHSLAGEQGRDWVVNDRGETIAQTTYDQRTHTWLLRLKRGGEWVDSYSTKALLDLPEVLGVSPDGASLLLRTFKDDGRVEHRLVSLADGALSEPSRAFLPYAELLHDPETQRIIGGQKGGMQPAYAFLEPKAQAAWDLVTKTFQDEQVDPVSWSHDRGKVVVKVTGPRHGIVYAVVDAASHRATVIGQAFEGIKPEDIADVVLVTYPAQDGRPIQAYLTLPAGREAKNLPLVVLPHGGPAARDDFGFDWWSQALAARGYAVLQPQFRGSAGLGEDLEVAGYGEFGRKMQSDLSDGVRGLAAKGYVDAKRVCIVGGSYGGYAALAGVTLEQGVYRCAVAVAGVSDMRRMVGSGLVDADRSSAVRFWDRYVGAKSPSDPVYDQISPARHAAEASAPILLIHGKDDAVVPYDQSVAMESALKAAHKPVEFVTLASEDHWLSREATRLQMLQATVGFLEKNNPPR